jgi:hypothetical protein
MVLNENIRELTFTSVTKKDSFMTERKSINDWIRKEIITQTQSKLSANDLITGACIIII